MTTDPLPPPEAALITQRIEEMVPPPSRSSLAREAGISPALWAKIEKGYDQPAPGLRVPYRGSARSVAAMASVLGITAAQLRRCKRADAARILAALPAPQPEPDSDAIEELRRIAETQREQLARLERKLDQALAGREHKEGDSDDEPNGSRRAG